MPQHNFVSQVTIKVSRDPDGKFRGHMLDGDQHVTTVATKHRKRAINAIIADAKAVLDRDNLVRNPTTGSNPAPSE